MSELTDIQRLILTVATTRRDRVALPLPRRIKGGAAKKVVSALLARGLIEDAPASDGAPLWREGDDGRALTLVATDDAFRALGLEPPAAHTKGIDAEKPRLRAGTKQAQMIAMLEASEGATITEIAEATGWQPHTVRGAIAGALKKRLGLNIDSEKVDGRGRVYRVTA